MQRTIELHYDKLIIGADLESVYFSYANKIPIIYLKKKFFPLYTLEKLEDLRKPRKEFEKMLSIVSFSFLNPMAEMLQAIRIESDNLLTATTKSNISVKITFNKLYISETDYIEGLPIPTGVTGDDNLVVDYLSVNSGHGHYYNLIETEEDFVKRVFFHRSYRFKFRQNSKKDCVCVSIIKTKDLDDYGFSDNAVRMKTVSIMKKAGIRGRWDKTNNRHKTLKLTARKRFIYRQWKNVYADLPKSIEILYNAPPVEINLNDIIK